MRDPKYQNNPKNGAVLKIKNNYDRINFFCDTVDKNTFKTLTLSFEGWITCETLKPTRTINRLTDNIKSFILRECNKYYFSERMIDINTLPESFDDNGSGFCSFEFTFFINRGVKFNREELIRLMNELVEKIYRNFFEQPIDFDIYKNRNEFNNRPINNWNPDEYYPNDTDRNERL